ncbi:MAG: dihydrolipoamide acetyltransferase family protein [Planctomycetota bacterium]|nr:dihydrolipoamide acetyltransferase family protein [Planctomycetota bacterium]
MTYEFKLPDLGEGVHEGQIIKLLVAEGDHIKEDQPLMEVETDKAAVEIPSPYTGIVSKIHAAEQQLVYVGDVMVTFDASPSLEGGDQGEGEASRNKSVSPNTETIVSSANSNGNASSGNASTTTITQTRRKPASPAVRRMAREKGLDLESITGSGPGGRITRADVDAALNAPTIVPSPSAIPTQQHTAIVHTPHPTEAETSQSLTPIAPPAPLLATDLSGTPGTDDYGAIVRQSISQARKAIAQVMSHSVTTIPHVTDSDDADVTELNKFRKGYSHPLDPSRKITMLAFVVRAVVKALQLHPIFNASFDADLGEIIYRRYFNIAIGVQTERGLLAPVIRDADRLNIAQLSDAITMITENARSASFAMSDMKGGTFTISNAGAMGGSRYSTPIINPPQVAVLAIGKSRLMPWIVEDEVKPRLIMPLSCSFDHRIIDGAQEITFARQIIEDLENPARLLL